MKGDLDINVFLSVCVWPRQQGCLEHMARQVEDSFHCTICWRLWVRSNFHKLPLTLLFSVKKSFNEAIHYYRQVHFSGQTTQVNDFYYRAHVLFRFTPNWLTKKWVKTESINDFYIMQSYFVTPKEPYGFFENNDPLLSIFFFTTSLNSPNWIFNTIFTKNHSSSHYSKSQYFIQKT